MNRNRDFWPQEREGYTDNLRPAYASVHLGPSPQRIRSFKLEERIGSLIAGAGLCWATWVVVHRFAVVISIEAWPPGPLEACAMGVLVWLHAKWRRFAKPQ